jgi:hypothetical protein
MSTWLAATLCAWIPFLNPVKLPVGARLWTFLPLVLCVAVVYRATRARKVGDMPKATLLTFVSIVAGMVAIAVGFFLVHRLALRLS